MTLKVIGAGFGRTGTLSLKLALEKLGFDKCYHMMEVNNHQDHHQLWAKAHRGEAVDWDALFGGYQASVDWPACNLWREQAVHFPDAKIILTLRNPESWYTSIMNTIYPSSIALCEMDDPKMRATGKWSIEIIWDRLFQSRMDDKAHVMEVFNRHNQTVMDEVPAERLLVYEAGQGWEPLCQFLGIAPPEEDYPRVNTTDQFQKNIMQRRQEEAKKN